jgi:trehalose 6-phosphate synthase
MLRRLALYFGIPLVVIIALGAVIAVPVSDRLLTQWFAADIEARARLVKNAVDESLEPLLRRPVKAQIDRVLARPLTDDRLVAILICGPKGRVVHTSDRLPAEVRCSPEPVLAERFDIVATATGRVHVARLPMEVAGVGAFELDLVQDLSFIDRRQTRALNYILGFAVVAAALLILASVLIAWTVLHRLVRSIVQDIRGKRFLAEPDTTRPADLVLDQVRTVLRELEQAQRVETDFRENWTPEALQHVVRDHLDSAQLMVVSNREPYIHNRDESGAIEVQYPASGMVTALEPVMRACSGTWVAHGSGTADRDVVDEHDRVAVPPDDPSYALRRVWLSAEEDEGYYYGFSNEGMWPLCHLAFVRPAFRPGDWAHYVAVNRKFADAIAREARGPRPIVLVQDYHFAMLPSLIRERLPEATIAIFWHIPWPNAEAFGICPWRQELLRGMLDADIVGFHTRQHCQNFLESVDRFVESHIDHEHGTVSVENHVCHVDAYPISIEWPPQWVDKSPPVAECRRRLQERFGLKPDVRIGVGVERWDFTKGIIDRIDAMERLLDTQPLWRGKVTLLQIAAPTRSKLPAYAELRRQTLDAAERVNARYGTADYKPIVLLAEHQNPAQVFELYRGCDFCVVNSLHDGMNLVAKEFVAARTDEDGVLILSTFAGASRELMEALIVNPFDLDETARSISRALTMPREEKRERMRIMRSTVKHNNVFRWAGRMLMDLARIRQRQRLRSLGVERARAARAVELTSRARM